jgi:hypothetical protein
VPSDIISFGFEDSLEDFEGGTTLNGLSDMTVGVVCEDIFLEAGVGVGTGTATGVFGAVGIAGVLGIAGTIVGAVEIGAARGVGLEASSSCARHSKTVS